MPRLRDLAAPYRIVLATAGIVALVLAHSTTIAVLEPGILPGFADKDFANYWMAGKLILGGRVMDLFGPQPIYFEHLRAALGDQFPWHNWSYPPHYLLIVWWLGFFGYKAGLLAFLAVTGVFFAWAWQAFAGRRTIAWVAVAPFVCHNFWVAQNGFLTGGLALGALVLRERRPVAAGILLGLLTVKPQLGLLFPFLLLAERRWTMIASAAATALALVAASAAIFGVDAWRGYLDEVVPYQAFVMRELEGTFLAMLPSLYGALRNWTLPADPALAIHLGFAIPVALLAILAMFRAERAQDRAVILLVATFLVTPYALSYDLGMFAAAVAVLAGSGRDEAPDGKVIGLLSIAMLLPVVMMPLGEMKVSIAPFVIGAVFWLALRRAGLLPNPFARRSSVAGQGAGPAE